MSDKTICANCGHGVSIHEWEDETTSCCLYRKRLFPGVGEGDPCMCPGFKPMESTPPKSAHIDTTAQAVTYVPTPSPITTTQEDEVDVCEKHGEAFCRVCRDDPYSQPKPAPQAEAQEVFEGTRFIEYLRNSDIHDAMRRNESGATLDAAVMLARGAWNAQQAKIDALEQWIQPVEKLVSDQTLVVWRCANYAPDAQNMAIELQQYRQRAESHLHKSEELEEKLREGK